MGYNVGIHSIRKLSGKYIIHHINVISEICNCKQKIVKSKQKNKNSIKSKYINHKRMRHVVILKENLVVDISYTFFYIFFVNSMCDNQTAEHQCGAVLF